jgi:hypothetical protein
MAGKYTEMWDTLQYATGGRILKYDTTDVIERWVIPQTPSSKSVYYSPIVNIFSPHFPHIISAAEKTSLHNQIINLFKTRKRLFCEILQGVQQQNTRTYEYMDE